MNLDFKMGGVLYVFYGTMNSDKTTQLLANVNSLGHSSASNAFMVFVNSRDSRGGHRRISTSNGLRHDEVFVCDAENPEKVREVIKSRESKIGTSQKVLLFDEGNLYDANFVSVIQNLLGENRTVAVYGLHTDFRGEPFNTMDSLLGIARRMETTKRLKLVLEGKAYCKVVTNEIQCEDSASYNMRLVKANGSSEEQVSFISDDLSTVSGFVRAPYYDPTIVVEGSSSRIKYTTTCERHFGILPGKDLVDKIKGKLKEKERNKYSDIIEGDNRAVDAVAFLVEEGYVNIIGGNYHVPKGKWYTDHDITELVKIAKARDSDEHNSATLSVLDIIKRHKSISREELLQHKQRGIERILGDLTKSGFISLRNAYIEPRRYDRL